jgi:RHS repeat-associated protein
VVESHRYWPFGDSWCTSYPCTPLQLERLGFAVMERDQESNHFYDHARPHDFNIGRFVSPDRIGGLPREPQSWNRYSHAGNNPVAFVDRNGMYYTIPLVLAPAYRDSIRRSYAEAVRRPSGRAMFNAIATNQIHNVTITSEKLNSDADLGKARFTKSDVKLTFGTTTFRRPDGTIGTTLDTDALREFGSRAGKAADPTGLTTAAHELFHQNDAIRADAKTFLAGDAPTSQTGPAQLFGEGVMAESPDLTTDQALGIVDACLEEGLELQNAQFSDDPCSVSATGCNAAAPQP